MNKEEIEFIKGYEDLLNKGYCNCNEMNCLGYDSSKKILSIVKKLQQENKEIKADLEMYENGVYFSSENDKLQNEIDNLNHIIDKQDKDITILSKGNKHLKEVIDKALDYIENNDIIDARLHNPHKNYGSINELKQILKGE